MPRCSCFCSFLTPPHSFLALLLLKSPAFPLIWPTNMELNPVRQRIADLSGRLDALRGYL